MSRAAAQPVRKIIVLGHDASRTGAPIFLLHLARWLKRNSDFEFEILLKNGGPLLAEFQQVAPTKVLHYTGIEMAIHRVCQQFNCKTPARFSTGAKITRHLRHRKIDLVYANTVAVAAEVAAMTRLGLPTLWHIHELPFVINAAENGQPFREASRHVEMFVAAAECVKRGLENSCGIPAEKIQVVHEFAPPGKNLNPDLAASRAVVRQELNLPPSAFVVGMCGMVGWRKGVDWFLGVAKHLATEFAGRDIRLVWIGAAENEVILNQVNLDLRQARLTERVKFIGVKSDSRHYLAALDAFLLSSREDPFPLAMLEAGSVGLPVVCFAESGGGPEFVAADAGIVVGYADTLAAAKALVKLNDEPQLRRQLGETARQKVLTRYSLEIQAPKILRLMEQVAP